MKNRAVDVDGICQDPKVKTPLGLKPCSKLHGLKNLLKLWTLDTSCKRTTGTFFSPLVARIAPLQIRELGRTAALLQVATYVREKCAKILHIKTRQVPACLGAIVKLCGESQGGCRYS